VDVLGEQDAAELLEPDDPPNGTIVFGRERVIYLGNGEWQPLEDTTNHRATRCIPIDLRSVRECPPNFVRPRQG
jgi:hypothetical protein